MPRKKKITDERQETDERQKVDELMTNADQVEQTPKSTRKSRETHEQASARVKLAHKHRQYISTPKMDKEYARLSGLAHIAVDAVDENGNINEAALQKNSKHKKMTGVAALQLQPTIDGQSPTETAKTIRLSLASLDLPPINIADPEQVKNRIIQYLEFCEDNDRMPSLVGMANWLGVPRQTLQNWKRGDLRSETHTPIIQQACTIMEEMLVEYFQKGKMNPAAGIFLLKNMFQYRDVQDVVVSPKNPIGDAQQQKQLEDKYLDIVESDD